MTKPRQTQVSLEETPYYHCISRCVRRAFLCGEDKFSGHSYEHRRQWIVDRLKELSAVFAIDICAYAVLSNHTHTVLRVDKERALDWSDKEVIERWALLYNANPLVSRFMGGDSMTAAERDAVSHDIETWRSRLYDISWFMRGLNEHIARKANQEDGCTGRFWEGKFKSQALLDEAAVLTCMSYVDLNPVRAGMAETPETSDFTSIQERIETYRLSNKAKQAKPDQAIPTPTGLMPFAGGEQMGKEPGIPFSFYDYLQLTDWTGRAIRDDKGGAIPGDIAPILECLKISPDAWLDNVRNYGHRYYRAVGAMEKIKHYSKALGQHWLCGVKAVQQMYKAVPT
ncbi:MAG TPA: transposase [Acidiferrobacteraceae bacterium]|nr:transposase [Acidiferrobacteraceae bacterium]